MPHNLSSGWWSRADEAVNKCNKAANVLKGITTANPLLIAAMQNIRSNPNTKATFAVASSKLSEQIALLFPGESRTTSGHRNPGPGLSNPF
jgi:hypothetical protein